MVIKTDKLTKKPTQTKKSWERGLWVSQMVQHHNYIGTINSGILLCDKVAVININALYIPKSPERTVLNDTINRWCLHEVIDIGDTLI